MKRSVTAQRKQGNEPEHIHAVLDRLVAKLGPPTTPTRKTPPDQDSLDVVVNILTEALQFVPGTPLPVRSAMATSIDIIRGDWPGTALKRIGGGK